MVINYFGGMSLKITQGDLTLSFNPPSKDSKLKASKFGADIALISLDHEDFNGVENAAFGDREPFVIAGPGEYEVRGVAVRGYAAKSTYGGEAGLNTIYSVALEGMNLCMLGAQSDSELPAAAKQELDDIDLLFLPVGPATSSSEALPGVLPYDKAYALAVKLEPKAIIPLYASEATLKSFLKEAGEDVKLQEKLTIKKKDLDGKEGEIIVLQS